MTTDFLQYPNLPEGRVSLALAGNYPEIVSALEKEGIKILSFSSSILPEETASHQDMLLCHTGNEYIFIEPTQSPLQLEKEGFSVIKAHKAGAEYPEDVKLNTAVSKDFFVCNKKTCDKGLFAFLEKSGKAPILVKQGYSKCSVCFVTENAVITEDEGIRDALRRQGTDVLFISKGDIFLSGKHYGFFGGSSGKIDKNLLAVTGELKFHRDGEKIKAFCAEHKVDILELKKGRIIDIGGILPLKEKR